jgi:YesN/AraC family two-component response regulator
MATILIIDDEPAMRLAIREHLKRRGHDVLEASNGRRGMDLLESERVDLVITDIIMPEQEGVETIQAIRKHHPGMRVIAMSGGGRYDDSEYYLSAARWFGSDFSLSKPFTANELITAVDNLLGAKDDDAEEQALGGA